MDSVSRISPDRGADTDDDVQLATQWQQAVSDARSPDSNIHPVQLAVPMPPPPPIAGSSGDDIPGLAPALDRAGRRLDYLGSEIAHGQLGSAAGHALGATSYPPEVDDPVGATITERWATPVPAAALPASAAAAEAQARSEGCKLAFVPEASSYADGSAWRAYEDQTPGAFTDPKTGARIVPALEYNNRNGNGAPFVRFDGFEPLANGRIEVIDSKRSVPMWENKGRMAAPLSVIDQLGRQSDAVEQNPGCEGAIHVPNHAEQAKIEGILRGQDINNLSVDVRPEAP